MCVYLPRKKMHVPIRTTWSSSLFDVSNRTWMLLVEMYQSNSVDGSRNCAIHYTRSLSTWTVTLSWHAISSKTNGQLIRYCYCDYYRHLKISLLNTMCLARVYLAQQTQDCRSVLIYARTIFLRASSHPQVYLYY